MDCDKLRAIGEGSLYLNIRKHLRHTLHYLVPRQYLCPLGHELRNRLAIPSSFENGRSDKRGGLWKIELEPSGPPALCQKRGSEEQFMGAAES